MVYFSFLGVDFILKVIYIHLNNLIFPIDLDEFNSHNKKHIIQSIVCLLTK